jgi:hypothetical protein
MTNTPHFQSEPIASLEDARRKAEESAAVFQKRFHGSYFKWIDTRTLRVFTEAGASIATLHLEALQ